MYRCALFNAAHLNPTKGPPLFFSHGKKEKGEKIEKQLQDLK